jgi:hypothetical protein
MLYQQHGLLSFRWKQVQQFQQPVLAFYTTAIRVKVEEKSTDYSVGNLS